MKKIILLSLLSLALFGYKIGFNESHTQNLTIDSTSSVKRSYYGHPDIKGFDFCYGYKDVMQKSEPTGYFIYDIDLYSSLISSNSDLFILRVNANFTPGHTGNINGNSYYDWNYMLLRGYIHSRPYQVIKDGKRSSSVHYVASWPKSSTTEATFTTTSSLSADFQRQFEIGQTTNIFKGTTTVSLNVKDPFTLHFGFSESVTETSPEPVLSHQLDNNEAQWNFKYAKSSDISYNLDTFYLFQVEHDNQGMPQDSFGFSVKIVLTCVAWEIYIWRQERDTVLDDQNDGYGI